MKNIIHNLEKYWVLHLSIFILGGVLFSLIVPFLKNTYAKFLKNASDLKKYWGFVPPFTIFTIIGYILILRFAPYTYKSICIDIFNQVLTLIFAIFVGYFAFLQVIESRFDKLKKEAADYISQKQYKRSISLYEQCLTIKTDDFVCWANLMEIYLIEKKFDLFDQKIIAMKKYLLEPVDSIKYFYLIVTKYLLKEHISEAKEEILQLIEYIKKDTSVLNKFGWNFDDIKKSPIYSNLDPEVKKYYEKLSDYLSSKLTPEQKLKYESGSLI